MKSIEYLSFDKVNPDVLKDVLNEESLRTHLIEHPYFDSDSVREWIAGKIEIDSADGCRVRVISISGDIAGWCGIQPDEEGFEVAIIISRRFWGSGMRIFKTIEKWAKELGHKEILFHLLDTRREYKALAQTAIRVSKTQLLGRSFTTYYFEVS